MPQETLTGKALNRALLARQILLAREETSTLVVIEHLVGLQAQLARPPFTGLWSRIAGFQREDLRSLIHSRQVVQGTLMRCTLHLMSSRDYAAFRSALQPALSLVMRSLLMERIRGSVMDSRVTDACQL